MKSHAQSSCSASNHPVRVHVWVSAYCVNRRLVQQALHLLLYHSHSSLSVILWVSAVQGCPLSGVPL